MCVCVCVCVCVGVSQPGMTTKLAVMRNQTDSFKGEVSTDIFKKVSYFFSVVNKRCKEITDYYQIVDIICFQFHARAFHM